MTKIQNSKYLAFDIIWDLDIVIWNLYVISGILISSNCIEALELSINGNDSNS